MRHMYFLFALTLTACNSVYFKPDSLEKNTIVYADRGGYSMRRSIKERLESRGYKVVVGTAKASSNLYDSNSSNIELDASIVPNTAEYIIKTSERSEKFAPIWCVFNGFWWWNFNVSIANQKTGEEIMTWRGRGCQNSSLRMLDNILDEMEIKQAE